MPTERAIVSTRGASRSGAHGGATRQRLERQHDQRVAGQHRQRLAEGAVHRRLAAPDRRIVEAGQVVVDQGGAMQQLDRGRRGVGRGRVVLAAGRARPRGTAGAGSGRRRGNTA